MCGITGAVHLDYPAEHMERIVGAMADSIAHRGPDGHGTWVDSDRGIAFGHRRLSIQDLSSLGAQPMVSAGGRFVITYNGEVYNYRALRSELEAAGCQFRGRSDTEVMLACFEHWGIWRSVERFVGMFAFGLLDLSENCLYLVRDRMGIKPLYYSELPGGGLIFGSELKALRTVDGFNQELNRDALVLFLSQNAVAGEYSIYQGTSKVLPGSAVRYDLGARRIDKKVYWSVANLAESTNPESRDTPELINELDSLLTDAVSLRMISDVPIGSFLSGGIDSTLVTALMQKISNTPVRTFSIGFEEEKFNEAPFAKSIAEHLGTDHVEMYVSPEQALAVVPELPRIYDEPFGDPSQVPTFLVSQLAASHVSVVLSGDGGDESFFGYDRYLEFLSIWKRLGWVPRSLSGAAELAFRAIGWAGIRKFRTAANLVRHCQTPSSLYGNMMAQADEPEAVVLGGRLPHFPLKDESLSPHRTSIEDRMMLYDQICYLPDDILVKVDRASMAVSLEARVPLIDHRVVEFAWGLPIETKYRNGQQKWLLRELLSSYVPRHMFERPKRGFTIPLGRWLCGPLREWAEELVSEERLRQEGYLDPQLVRTIWSDYQAGRRAHNSFFMWSILMFQAWLENSEQSMVAR